MPLFSAISADVMDDTELLFMSGVCAGILPKLEELETDHPHRADYLELQGRLEAEQRKRAAIAAERTRAAITLQSAARGMLVRKDLARRANAALVIHCAVRQHQARKKLQELKAIQAEAFQREQERQVQEQLAREAKVREDAEAEAAKHAAKKAADIDRGNQKLTGQNIDLARVNEAKREALDSLIGLYEEALSNKKPGAKQGHPTVRKINEAKNRLDSELSKIVTAVEAALASEAEAAILAQSVTLPADFHRLGALVKYGTFYYPGAGYLKIGDKMYNFHPNRTFVHVRQEVADNAALADAQRYLDSCLAACRQVIAAGSIGTHQRAFADGKNWKIIYQAGTSGYAGEIIHIDSKYERSNWLPAAKQGMCKTCGKAKNYHEGAHPII